MIKKYLQSYDEKQSHKNCPQQKGVVSRLHFQIIMEICANGFVDTCHRFSINLGADANIVSHFAGAIRLNHPGVVGRIVEGYGRIHFLLI
jgi:hypothetical protein